MSELATTLIAAGSATAGGIVTGWYTRSAGIRQAAAARHAGERQADALLASVRMTLQGEAAQRALALRRQVYADFLGAVEARILAERTGRGRSTTKFCRNGLSAESSWKDRPRSPPQPSASSTACGAMRHRTICTGRSWRSWRRRSGPCAVARRPTEGWAPRGSPVSSVHPGASVPPASGAGCLECLDRTAGGPAA